MSNDQLPWNLNGTTNNILKICDCRNDNECLLNDDFVVKVLYTNVG